MARRKSNARREPVFDADPGSQLDVRLSPEDRAGNVARDERAAPARRPRKRTSDETPHRKPPDSKAKKARRSGGKGGGFGRLVYWLLVLALWAAIGGGGLVVWIGAHLPSIDQLQIPKRPPNIEIVGLNGTPLATRGDMGGAAVPLRELPAYVPKAFIAIEDRRFYSHYGVDPVGIGRALVANALHRGVSQGGSTLTQQLAKNLFLTQERTLKRKAQEALLAIWLERKYSKAQILELYLNRVYFGSGAYGVEAAAQRYFAKSARLLTLAEAATLAGLVKSPSRLAPNRNPTGAAQRAQLVLTAMAEQGLVKDDAVKAALAAPAHAVKPIGAGSVNYVADWIMDVLSDLVGQIDQDLIVTTSIDPAMQAAAEKTLVEELNAKGDKAGVAQGALVAMAPDGAVRALVGGRNYSESQYNRAVVAKRQPGSAFKPFVYLTALERGLTPDTVREDGPINIKGWRPENYSHEYYGRVNLTQALAMSLNTVSVRLAVEFGPTAVVRTAHRLGIASKLEPNASLALGTSEVSVMELLGAYAVFANGGFAVTPHVIEQIRTAKGKLLYMRPADDLGRIVEPHYVGMMNAMLQQTLLIGTAQRARLPGWPAAGKTGTSQDFRDAWFVGYTGTLATAVWLGNDDGSPTRKTTGGGLPVEIWSRFMKTALRGIPPVDLPGLRGTAAPPPLAMPNEPIPPPQQTAQTGPAQAPGRSNSLDQWLVERLFGR